jgi:hypothetical protein
MRMRAARTERRPERSRAGSAAPWIRPLQSRGSVPRRSIREGISRPTWTRCENASRVVGGAAPETSALPARPPRPGRKPPSRKGRTQRPCGHSRLRSCVIPAKAEIHGTLQAFGTSRSSSHRFLEARRHFREGDDRWRAGLFQPMADSSGTATSAVATSSAAPPGRAPGRFAGALPNRLSPESATLGRQPEGLEPGPDSAPRMWHA